MKQQKQCEIQLESSQLDHNQEVKSLKELLEKQKEESSTMLSKWEKADQMNKSMKKKLTDYYYIEYTAKQNMTALTEQLANCQQQVDTNIGENGELKENLREMNTIRTELSKCSSDVSTVSKAYTQCKGDLNTNLDKQNQCKSEIDRLKFDIKQQEFTLGSTVNKTVDGLGKCYSNLKKLENESSQWQYKAGQTTKELDLCNNNVKQISKEHTEYKSNIHQNQDNALRLKICQRQLEDKRTELEESGSNKSPMNQTLVNCYATVKRLQEESLKVNCDLETKKLQSCYDDIK